MRKNFLWGASESGFQFEMGDKEKKSLDPNTDWFAWVHDEENIKNKIVSGDLPENGIDYWDLFKVDHKIAKELGMNAYRIGIEWSRILNDAHDIEVYTEVNEDTNLFEKIVIEEEDLEKLLKRVNKKNVERYREIIEDLRSKDIKVIVCLNHFTLPLWIHNPLVARKTDLEKGPLGWADNLTVVEFTKFASVAAYLFGDLVDMWATLNEPFVVTELGYLLPEAGFPPGVASVAGYFTATANITNAHVRAYDAIKKWDQVKADDSDVPAFVGIIHNMGATQPLDPNNEKDLEVAKFLDYARNRWLFNAIVRGEVDLDLDLQISDEEKISSFKNRLDWIGVNYYSRMVVKRSDKPLVPGFDMASFEIVEGYGSFCKPNSVSKDGRPTSDFGWEIYPEGLRDVLKIASEYKLPIYVTENGIADAQDKYRSAFIVQHVHQVELAIDEDKLDVRGYLHWALTDNYEWADGFSKRFGLVEVDLTTKERRKRKSAEIFKEIAQNSGLTDKLRKEYLTK